MAAASTSRVLPGTSYRQGSVWLHNDLESSSPPFFQNGDLHPGMTFESFKGTATIRLLSNQLQDIKHGLAQLEHTHGLAQLEHTHAHANTQYDQSLHTWPQLDQLRSELDNARQQLGEDEDHHARAGQMIADTLDRISDLIYKSREMSLKVQLVSSYALSPVNANFATEESIQEYKYTTRSYFSERRFVLSERQAELVALLGSNVARLPNPLVYAPSGQGAVDPRYDPFRHGHSSHDPSDSDHTRPRSHAPTMSYLQPLISATGIISLSPELATADDLRRAYVSEVQNEIGAMVSARSQFPSPEEYPEDETIRVAKKIAHNRMSYRLLELKEAQKLEEVHRDPEAAAELLQERAVLMELAADTELQAQSDGQRTVESFVATVDNTEAAAVYNQQDFETRIAIQREALRLKLISEKTGNPLPPTLAAIPSPLHSATPHHSRSNSVSSVCSDASNGPSPTKRSGRRFSSQFILGSGASCRNTVETGSASSASSRGSVPTDEDSRPTSSTTPPITPSSQGVDFATPKGKGTAVSAIDSNETPKAKQTPGNSDTVRRSSRSLPSVAQPSFLRELKNTTCETVTDQVDENVQAESEEEAKGAVEPAPEAPASAPPLTAGLSDVVRAHDEKTEAAIDFAFVEGRGIPTSAATPPQGLTEPAGSEIADEVTSPLGSSRDDQNNVPVDNVTSIASTTITTSAFSTVSVDTSVGSTAAAPLSQLNYEVTVPSSEAVVASFVGDVNAEDPSWQPIASTEPGCVNFSDELNTPTLASIEEIIATLTRPTDVSLGPAHTGGVVQGQLQPVVVVPQAVDSQLATTEIPGPEHLSDEDAVEQILQVLSLGSVPNPVSALNESLNQEAGSPSPILRFAEQDANELGELGFPALTSIEQALAVSPAEVDVTERLMGFETAESTPHPPAHEAYFPAPTVGGYASTLAGDRDAGNVSTSTPAPGKDLENDWSPDRSLLEDFGIPVDADNSVPSHTQFQAAAPQPKTAQPELARSESVLALAESKQVVSHVQAAFPPFAGWTSIASPFPGLGSASDMASSSSAEVAASEPQLGLDSASRQLSEGREHSTRSLSTFYDGKPLLTGVAPSVVVASPDVCMESASRRPYDCEAAPIADVDMELGLVTAPDVPMESVSISSPDISMYSTIPSHQDEDMDVEGVSNLLAIRSERLAMDQHLDDLYGDLYGSRTEEDGFGHETTQQGQAWDRMEDQQSTDSFYDQQYSTGGDLRSWNASAGEIIYDWSTIGRSESQAQPPLSSPPVQDLQQIETRSMSRTVSSQIPGLADLHASIFGGKSSAASRLKESNDIDMAEPTVEGSADPCSSSQLKEATLPTVSQPWESINSAGSNSQELDSQRPQSQPPLQTPSVFDQAASLSSSQRPLVTTQQTWDALSFRSKLSTPTLTLPTQSLSVPSPCPHLPVLQRSVSTPPFTEYTSQRAKRTQDDMNQPSPRSVSHSVVATSVSSAPANQVLLSNVNDVLSQEGVNLKQNAGPTHKRQKVNGAILPFSESLESSTTSQPLLGPDPPHALELELSVEIQEPATNNKPDMNQMSPEESANDALYLASLTSPEDSEDDLDLDPVVPDLFPMPESPGSRHEFVNPPPPVEGSYNFIPGGLAQPTPTRLPGLKPPVFPDYVKPPTQAATVSRVVSTSSNLTLNKVEEQDPFDDSMEEEHSDEDPELSGPYPTVASVFRPINEVSTPQKGSSFVEPDRTTSPLKRLRDDEPESDHQGGHNKLSSQTSPKTKRQKSLTPPSQLGSTQVPTRPISPPPRTSGHDAIN